MESSAASHGSREVISIQINSVKEGGGSEDKREQRDKETALRRREAEKYRGADRKGNGTGTEKTLNLLLPLNDYYMICL